MADQNNRETTQTKRIARLPAFKKYDHSVETVKANATAFFKQIDDELNRKEQLKMEYVRIRMSRIYYNDWKMDANSCFRTLVVLKNRLLKDAQFDLLTTKGK
jgi:hypothetical protein